MTHAEHIPVLLSESVEALRVQPGSLYVDGTFGGGGHTRALLEASKPDGRVIAFDLDAEAIARAERLRSSLDSPDRLLIVHDSFRRLSACLNSLGIEQVDGVLFDLGLSSFQLADAGRGFTFQEAGPIDMRFNQSVGIPASELIATCSKKELADLLWKFGDERRSRRIAAAIAKARQSGTLQTTEDLADVVSEAVGGRRGAKTHPATKTFQALRIATNDELASLTDALKQSVTVLKPGGRLAVISFHSLEDRIVKQFMRRESASCICPEGQPICTCDHLPTLRLVGRAQRASEAEIDKNWRSRSAVLRVAERL